MEDPVSYVGIPLVSSRFPLHCRLVTPQEIDVIAHHQKLGECDVVLRGLKKCVLGLRQAVQLNIGPGKIVIRRREVRIESDSPLGFFERLFIPAKFLVNPRQIRARGLTSRG